MTTFSKYNFPKFYPIANLDNLKDPLLFIEGLILSGVSLLQLRSKELSRDSFVKISAEAIKTRNNLRDKHNKFTLIVINDSPEICKLIGADGVHLGQEDIATKAALNLLGPNSIIGLSTHTNEQVKKANELELTYIGVGPVFKSATKSGHASELGLDGIREAALLTRFPLVAIGGITTTNAKEVYQAGANSVAVIGDLLAEQINGQIDEQKNKLMEYIKLAL